MNQQGCHTHLAHQDNQEGELYCDLAGGKHWGKMKDPSHRELRYIWEEWFQWAQTFSSFYTQKSTKFLNLRYLVFFNSQKYFQNSDYLPRVANFYITWLLPLPPQSSSLRVNWDAVSQAKSPKNSRWIKLDYDYSLSQQYCDPLYMVILP